MNNENNISYWDIESAEYLQYVDKDEAIEAILSDCEETPLTITLCGYRRLKIKESPESIAEDVLDRLLETLDDEYGGEDSTEITEEMKEIAKEFVEKFIPLYPVWRCEIVCREKIDVNKWRAKKQAN